MTFIMNNELISIIIPTYNCENTISETIKSVLNQTYKNWELIITDDKSVDSTFSILMKFQNDDNRIKVHQLTVNSGAAIARNNSIKFSNGRFIAFLDSDDIWYDEKLKIQYDFMNKKKCSISFTSYELINEYGEPINKKIKADKEVNYKSYLKNTIIGMSTSMIDRYYVKEINFINIRTRQDTYLWINLLKKGNLAYGIQDVLAKYRLRKNSISANKYKAAKQVWRLLYDFEQLGFFKSLYYFSFYAINAIKKRFL